MEKSLFKKFDYYWFCYIFTIILCFGFYLTNHSIGIDDELFRRHTNIYNMFFIGRPGRFIWGNFFHTFEYLPFWREFLAVCAYSLGIALHAQNFINFLNFEKVKFDKKMALIFSCIAVSFPYIAFNFIFMVTNLEHGINMILSALAVNYFYLYLTKEKKKRYLAYILILLTAIFSVYEANILFFVISCLFIQIVNLLFNKDYSVKNALKELCFCGLITLSSVVLNMIIVVIGQLILGYRHFRSEEFFSYDITSVKAFLLSFYKVIIDFCKNFAQTLSYNFGSVLILICAVIFFFYSSIISERKKCSIFLLFAFLLFLTPLIPLIVEGLYSPPYRLFNTFAFVVAMVVVLLYITVEKNTVLSRVIMTVSVLIVFYNSQMMNRIFYFENIKFQNDKIFANNIYYDLSRLNLQNKPVIFLGLRENPVLKYNFNEADEINISIFNWDRYDSLESEVFVQRPHAFMKELGYNIDSVFSTDIWKKDDLAPFYDEIKKKSKNMNIYPNEGYIRAMNDYVLVKIGPSEADK